MSISILNHTVCMRICDEINKRLVGRSVYCEYSSHDGRNQGSKLYLDSREELGFFNHELFTFYMYWRLRKITNRSHENDELNLADPEFLNKLVDSIKQSINFF